MLTDLLTKWLAAITDGPESYHFRVGDNAPDWTVIVIYNASNGEEVAIIKKGDPGVELEGGEYNLKIILKKPDLDKTTFLHYNLKVAAEELVASNILTWGTD